MVSIVTPVHNSEKYLIQCIQSVISQTYKNWEHILVDDCSKDNSADIILKHAAEDSRIKYVKLQINSGAGIARNKAIEMASGRFIAFLDSDDVWHKDKLIRQVKFMQQNKYSFTFTSFNKIDEKGIVVSNPVRIKNKVTYNKALFKNPIGCLTVMFDAKVLGKQFMPSIRKRQDYALWLKLLKKTNAYGIQECLASYRQVPNSISSNKLDLIKYEWKIYREEEKLSFVKSLFYLLTAIILKMKTYF